MRFWSNDYTELKQENIEEMANLKGSIWGELNKVLSYLSTFPISMFQREVITKEMIGMAKEAEIEGITLEEKLGIPPKEFCDSLVKGGTDKKPWEFLMTEVFNLLLDLIVVVSLYQLFERIDGIILGEIIITLISVPAFIDNVKLSPASGFMMYSSKKQKGILIPLKIISIVFGIVLFVAWVLLPDSILNMVIVPGDVKIIIFILITIAVAFRILSNYYWNSQSKQYQ